MSVYSGIIETAFDLIDRFGQPVVIITRTQGAYDPATSSAPVTENSVTVRGVTKNFSNKDVDGQLILQGDLELLLAASGLTKPSTNDKASIGGIKYTIKNVIDISPGGESVLYKVQLRK